MPIYLHAIGISGPCNATICEGESKTFTCKVNISNMIDRSDILWYRFIKDASAEEVVNLTDININSTTSVDTTNITTSLTITNARESYTGYYWVTLSSDYDETCNVSLTVTTSTYVYAICCICTETETNEFLLKCRTKIFTNYESKESMD